MRWHCGALDVVVRRYRRAARAVSLVAPFLLLLCATTARSASDCDPASIAIASHHRLARSSQNNMDHAANAENCRAYFKEFVEAVIARQTAATCRDGLRRERAFEILDAEIQRFNDRISAQSCEQ
jgi:hypothetical protein